MQKGLWTLLVIVVILLVGFMLAQNNQQGGVETEEDSETDITTNETSTMDTITLSSNAFEHGGTIPNTFTCDGENISPPLSWSGVPEEAQSLVLIMDDPDAVKPAGHVWDHWVVFNIPTTLTAVSEGEEPQGTHGITSSNTKEYGGPCPPDGEHRYFFKLYALDTNLDLQEGATKKDVEEAMEGYILAKGELMGRYERQ